FRRLDELRGEHRVEGVESAALLEIRCARDDIEAEGSCTARGGGEQPIGRFRQPREPASDEPAQALGNAGFFDRQLPSPTQRLAFEPSLLQEMEQDLAQEEWVAGGLGSERFDESRWDRLARDPSTSSATASRARPESETRSTSSSPPSDA